jgi:hypothetical protein
VLSSDILLQTFLDKNLPKQDFSHLEDFLFNFDESDLFSISPFLDQLQSYKNIYSEIQEFLNYMDNLNSYEWNKMASIGRGFMGKINWLPLKDQKVFEQFVRFYVRLRVDAFLAGF